MSCNDPCPTPSWQQIPLAIYNAICQMLTVVSNVLAALGGSSNGDLYILGTLYKAIFSVINTNGIDTSTTLYQIPSAGPVAGVRYRILNLRISASADVIFEIVAAPAANVAPSLATQVSGKAFYSAKGGEDTPFSDIGIMAGPVNYGLYIRTDADVEVGGSIVIVPEVI